jgi:hypothetical protein
MAQSGFQSNSTVTATFWWYKPDVGSAYLETMLEISQIHKIECTLTHDKVWLYYSATTGDTSSQAYILTGEVAVAFMNDMEGLFR